MPQYFTREGLEKMKKELYELKTTEMRRIVKLIAEAAAFGDLKENAGYHDARGMKSFLLGRIEQLQIAINEAVVVDKDSSGSVGVGGKVTIMFGDKKEEYEVVGPTEADILNNKISYASPLGMQLMKKKVGDSFDFYAGTKKVKVKIVSIR